ncbi:MAG: hypothetical protein ABI895_03315 [Deltaproteobacteria bacterium]
MSTARFEPIAIEIARVLSVPKLLPADVLEQTRSAQLMAAPEDQPWPAELEELMLHYMALVHAAGKLLGAPPFERLARLYEQLEEEYQPSGPPKSPVYNSYSMQHILAEVPQGVARETPYSVLARLTRTDPARARLHRLAQTLADSHLDLYRVKQATASAAELVHVRSDASVSVLVTGPFLRDEDLALARVLRFEERAFIADSPYLLKASVQDWLEYVERVAAAHAGSAADRVAQARSLPAGAKLSAKQLAQRRKLRSQAASESGTDEALVRHLKHGASARFWFEYVVHGYAGERNGIVYLAGVPDRPETLPHGDA